VAVKKGETMQDTPFEDVFQEDETHITEYLMVLSKRKTLIILVFILTVAATMFYTFTADPIYQSSAKLIIDKERSSSPITGERTDFESYQSETMTFNTNIKMIKSTPLLTLVIKTLKLDAENKDQDLEVSFVKELVVQFKANIKLLLNMEEKIELSPAELENRKIQQLVSMLKDKVEVEQIRDTRLLNLTVKDKDPALAADMANTLAIKHIEFTLSGKMESSKQTLAWLNNELYELRKNLEDAERKFFEYKQINKVFSITGKQKMAEQKIGEFNNKYLETRNKRLGLDAKINELTQNIKGTKGVANVRSLIENPIIDTIYGKIVDLELELTRRSKIFKSKHPKILQINSELNRSRKRLDQEIQKEFENLKSERKVLAAREKTLEKTISEFETDALDSSTKELKYTILQRNVTTSQNLYDLMVSRVKESNILQTSDTSNIRLVEKAIIPISPVSPNKKRNLLLSIVLGLFAGAGLAFFLEYMDQTIRTEEDIHTHFNIPVLSVIPEAET
jgi:polysaccharide biosynthesis transport protein